MTPLFLSELNRTPLETMRRGGGGGNHQQHEVDDADNIDEFEGRSNDNDDDDENVNIHVTDEKDTAFDDFLNQQYDDIKEDNIDTNRRMENKGRFFLRITILKMRI